MSRFEVYSTHVEYSKDKDAPSAPPKDVLEVSRSDPKVANEDAAIIREVFKRKAWVRDTQEG